MLCPASFNSPFNACVGWWSRAVWAALCVAVLLSAGAGPSASASARSVARADTTTQWTFVDRPLREVLTAVEARTGLRFLYRDALVAGLRVTVRASGRVLPALRGVLREHGLRLAVDAQRRQGLITPAPDSSRSPPQRRPLTGHVLDAQTGTPLPLATLTWTEAGRRQGVAADEDGRFRLRLDGALATRDTLHLRVSYVGYDAQTLRLSLDPPPPDVSVRLPRHRTTVPEVVVQSEALASEVDAAWRSLMRPSLHATLGDPGVLQALQPLPSVTIGPSLADGTIVRGSPADGFDVRLDGMPLFNQTHLFGLFDAFNDDVLQTVGFYYGVPPVRYPGPPGGTLAFRTRTGSQTGVRGSAGVSTTTAEATLEGPLAGGRASWMLSARRSYLDALRWMGTDALLAQGVGVDPEAGPPAYGSALNLTQRRPTDPNAAFYDVHGSVSMAFRDGGRLTFSAYAGGDETSQQAERLFVRPGDRLRDRLDLQPVGSASDWGNEAASLRLHLPLTETLYAHHTLAVSRYRAAARRNGFATTDVRVDDPASLQAVRTTDNDLWLSTWTQRVDGTLARGTWTAGYALSGYALTYADAVNDATRYRQERKAGQADAFAEAEHTWAPWFRTRTGLRVHGFSRGPFVRLSPRVHASFPLASALSLGIGYSRTHQFVHRLRQEGANAPDVWVMSSEDQPPHAADHITARVALQLAPEAHVQVEGYWKEQRDVRLYPSQVLGIAALTARPGSLPALRSGRPFLRDNALRARGIETMLRLHAGPLQWTGSYTLSAVDLRQTRAEDRSRITVPAAWERRHQASLRVVAPISASLTAVATVLYASGAPDMLHAFDADLPARVTSDSRLRPFHRLDLGLRAQGTWQNAQWTARATIQNVYDRDNPWYREEVLVALPTRTGLRPAMALREVYALGLQPALSVSVAW